MTTVSNSANNAHYSILGNGVPDSEQHLTEFALSVLHGLSAEPRRLNSRYFYDDRGSEIFQQIMNLPEYYVTRCEAEILANQSNQIVAALDDEPIDLVELGSGDGSKTMLLLQAFAEAQRELKYVPIDISEGAMKDLLQRLRGERPEIQCEGLVGDYFHGLNRLGQISKRRKVVLFLGANIGNFAPEAARNFLQSLWFSLNDGDFLLIGIDLRKNIEIMQRAYFDSQGVTQEFNRNLLRRINRELGGDFDIEAFDFEAVFNIKTSAVESFLTAKRDLTVNVVRLHRSFEFSAGESIQTESSFKYRQKDIETLAEKSGFEIVSQFFDGKRYFVDSLWRVRKQPN